MERKMSGSPQVFAKFVILKWCLNFGLNMYVRFYIFSHFHSLVNSCIYFYVVGE